MKDSKKIIMVVLCLETYHLLWEFCFPLSLHLET